MGPRGLIDHLIRFIQSELLQQLKRIVACEILLGSNGPAQCE